MLIDSLPLISVACIYIYRLVFSKSQSSREPPVLALTS